MTRISQNSRPRRLTLRPLDQAQNLVPAGSLIISDVFTSSQDSHGVAVAKAAHDLGFEGSVFYQQASHEPLPELQDSHKAAELLAVPFLEPKVVEKALHRFAVGPALHMILTGTEEVNRANLSGAKHSVLNLSSGVCKAQVTSMIYHQAASAWNSSQDDGSYVSKNLAQLYDLDHRALCSEDPHVAGPERQRLQQHLVDTVTRAWNNEPRIAEERDNFASAVRRFESRQNSVVIAAGNEGLVKPSLKMTSGGELRVPEDFEENILESPQVTSVGATIILDGVEAPARYSSTWSGVDIYASGDTVLGQEFDDNQGLRGAGTSIAAPRISALMAKMHAENPEFSSREVEQKLTDGFTQGPASMLIAEQAQLFLQG